MGGLLDEVALEAMVYDEATALPGSRVLGLPAHPGVEGGAALALAAGAHTRLDARAHLGAFHHAGLAVGGTLDGGLAVEHAFTFGAVVGAEVGVGALWSRGPDGEYVKDGGEWTFRHDAGLLAVRPSLAAELGWRLGAGGGAPRLLFRYRAWVEAPFSPGFIPVMIHGDTGFALRIPLAPRSW